MKHTLALALLGSCIVLVGCKKQATYIDPDSPDTIVSMDRINIQDFSRAAEEMSQSLLNSGRIKIPQGEDFAVLGISRIINDTTQRVDTDLLVKQIRVAMNQSDKLRTVTTYGLGGAEDPLAQRTREDRDFQEGTTTLQTLPDYTLSGKILEDQVRAGKTRQASYIFQLSLTETDTGLAAWEDQRTIVKQGSKPAVGW
jgi:hypothetical protein